MYWQIQFFFLYWKKAVVDKYASMKSAHKNVRVNCSKYFGKSQFIVSKIWNISDYWEKGASLEKKSTKYQELIDYVYNLIDDGTLKSGDRLFSENELSAMFHISRQTVSRAIGER